MASEIPNSTSVPLLLFALTAQLYINHLRSSSRHPAADDTDDVICNTAKSSIETDEERRLRRNLRLSIDSPDFSEHHFHDSPQRSGRSVRWNQSFGAPSDEVHKSGHCLNDAACVGAADHDDDSEGQNGRLASSSSVTFLHTECPRWRKLMERVSIADSVLTRVSCLFCVDCVLLATVISS